MPQTTLYDRTGKTVGSVELSDELFAAPGQRRRPPPGRDRPARRPPDRHARHQDPRRGPRRRREAVPPEGHRPRPPGLATAPHYRGGGGVFGPHPRSYEQRLPRKMKRLALRGALTAKLGDEAIKVVDTFGLEPIKTKDLVGVLGALEATAAACSSSPPAATRSSSCRRATCRRSR